MLKRIIFNKKPFLVLLLLFFMVIFVCFSDKYVVSSLNGLKLFAVSVLPSSLPFFFLTLLITRLSNLTKLVKIFNKPCNLLFKQSGLSVYAFTMSVLSGYPVGSRIVFDLHKNQLINDSEAGKMSLLCSTSGPLFVIGAVGVCMFKNKYVGFLIYFSHVLSAILNGLIFRNFGSYRKNACFTNLNDNVDNVLYECIYSSVISTLIVGGFVSIFYVFADILNDFYILLPLQKFFSLIFYPLTSNEQFSKSFTIGLIECTKGLKNLSALSISPLTVSLATGMVSFGGISIILQSIIYLTRCNVKCSFFLFGKLIQMITSMIISYIFYFLFF